MEQIEKEQKKTREREANWGPTEKEFFRECIGMHLDVVENRGNDVSMVRKKKKVWEAIRNAMVSAGYEREIPKLKSQWVRMKVSARKAAASVKNGGNSIVIPEVSTEDNLVQSMISHEFEEDAVLTDSNCDENQNSCEFLDCKFIHENQQEFLNESQQKFANNETSNPTTPHLVEKIEKEDFSPFSTPLHSYEDMPKNKNCSSTSNLKRLRTPSKNSIILERQRQIAKETLNSDEISKLQKKQLIEEIDHNERLHKMKELHEKELHDLKLQQLKRKIDHDEELHNLKLEILRKGSSQIFIKNSIEID